MITRARRFAVKIVDARRPGEPLADLVRRLWRWQVRAAHVDRSKLNRPDIQAVARLLKSGAIAYGPQVSILQNRFASMYGVRSAVASSSGTAAVHVALAMIGLEPGDEVIVPPVTDMGTILPILAQNAIPIFADIDPETWNIDPAAVEAQVTSRTRAVIAVHLFGNPCDLDRLKAIAGRHNLRLIEDCAQAHWARYKGRPVGTIGDIGTFSLQWTKHITTCEGGMTITDNPDFGERGRLFVDKGWNRGGPPGARQYPIFGLNYRLSEMQAALGQSQLARAKNIVQRRHRNARLLIEMLADTPGLTFQRVLEGCTHAYWQIGATVAAEAPFTAEALAECLTRRRIFSATHYIGRPIHQCHDPLRQRKIFGTSDLPFGLSDRADDLDYTAMARPVAADMLNRLAIFLVPNQFFTEKQVRDIGMEIKEVIDQLSNPDKMQIKPAARYKIGVVGCGKIAQQHLEHLERIPAVKVAAIADVNDEALKNVGSRFGVSARYSEASEMFAKENLDLVLILTWPTQHADLVIAAARQGLRAVLCEKPVASNLAEAGAMIEAARKAGTLLVIGHQHRFNPHLVTAREMIRAGQIGPVRHAWAHCRSSLINNGSHLIDGLLYMLGDEKVDWILGQIHRRQKQFDRGQPVEDGSMGLVCLRNGIRANIEMGDTAVPDIGWHFYGDLGKIDVGMDQLRVVGKSHRKIKRIEHLRVQSMKRQVEEIIDCLEGRTERHRGDAELGYAAMEVLIGLLESARLGEVVHTPVTQMRYPLDLPAQAPEEEVSRRSPLEASG